MRIVATLLPRVYRHAHRLSLQRHFGTTSANTQLIGLFLAAEHNINRLQNSALRVRIDILRHK